MRSGEIDVSKQNGVDRWERPFPSGLPGKEIRYLRSRLCLGNGKSEVLLPDLEFWISSSFHFHLEIVLLSRFHVSDGIGFLIS